MSITTVLLQRECRHGHGPLELLMGSFALTGVFPPPAKGNAIESLFAAAGPRRPNGSMLALRVFRCPQCGYVELVDHDSA